MEKIGINTNDIIISLSNQLSQKSVELAQAQAIITALKKQLPNETKEEQ